MENALIVSSSKKSSAFFSDVLKGTSIKQIAFLQSCSKARMLLSELDFDLVVIDAPLKDETGEELSLFVASKDKSQIILAAENEFFDAISAICENYGILTISKPVNNILFGYALALAKSLHGRIKRMQAQNRQLEQKIEEMSVINRAKWLLAHYMSMDEKKAHRYIEKRAMDLRITKRAVAEGILKMYA